MADTRTPVIEIRTLEAIQNVKELKDNISALKQKIDSVDTATEEYSNLTKELSRNQAALRNVMNGTNSTFDKSIQEAQGLDSSYNSLVQQLKEATQEWRTIPRYLDEVDEAQGKVNQEWTDAAERVKSLRDELKSMDAETGNFTRNVGNYSSALQGMKQVGNDVTNGLSSMSTVLGLVGVNTGTLDNLMKGLRTTIGLVSGAKGLLGLITGFKNTTKAEQADTVATKANTTARVGNSTATAAGTAAHAASTVAKTAETTATWSLKTAVDALKAALSGGLSVVISVITTALSGLVSWLFSAKEEVKDFADDVKDAAQEAEDAYDKIDNKLKKASKGRKLEIKVMEAEGRKEEEIHKRQQEIYNEDIADREAQNKADAQNIKQLEDWLSAYEKARKKQKKQFADEKEEKEAWLKQIKESTSARTKEIEAIKEEQIEEQALYDARQRNPNKNGNSSAAADAAREAANALKEIQDIFDSSLQGVDKINAKYDAAFKKLAENVKKARVSEEVANKARAILEKQKTKELREEYAKQYNDRYKAYKDTVAVLRKEKDETENVYKGLIPALKDNYEERVKLYDRQSAETKRRLEEDVAAAKRILGDNLDGSQWGTYLNFMTKTNAELKGLYLVMLNDEKAFADAWGEQFVAALKNIGPAIIDSESQTKKDLTQYVNDLMQAYQKAVQENDVQTAAILRDKLIGNPPVAEDEELLAAAQDFVKRMDLKIAESLINSENPLEVYFKGTNWEEQMGIYLEKYNKILDDENATFKEKYDARIKILEAFAKKYQSFMNSYGKATSNVLENVGDAWEAVLQRRVKLGKMEEEEAKKSFENVKNLQVAAAVINTAGAVVQALADTTVPSYYVKVANAAAALAAGTAQVIKIKNTEFGGSGDAASSTPKMVDRTPQLQYTIGLNTADYAEAQAQTPIRAYVVDRDLADGLDEYNKQKNETTF